MRVAGVAPAGAVGATPFDAGAAWASLALQGTISGLVVHAMGGFDRDAARAAVARGADVLLLDTAGRLHTKVNLMEELKKIRRVIAKAQVGAPHEVLLVLDGSAEDFVVFVGRTFGVTGTLVAAPMLGIVLVVGW